MTRQGDMIRLAASTSFNDDEVAVLDEALRFVKTKAPRPPAELARRPEIGTILAKLQVMRRAMKRNRAERERLIALGRVRMR